MVLIAVCFSVGKLFNKLIEIEVPYNSGGLSILYKSILLLYYYDTYSITFCYT